MIRDFLDGLVCVLAAIIALIAFIGIFPLVAVVMLFICIFGFIMDLIDR